MFKRCSRSLVLVSALAWLSMSAADEGKREEEEVQVSRRRERRQCSCVSQYTPVNCRCKTTGTSGELICRCDRAAILNNSGSVMPQCSCGSLLPPSTPPLYPTSPPPPLSPPFSPLSQLPYSPASAYASCQPVCRQNCMQSICGNNAATVMDGLADVSDVGGCAATPNQSTSQCAFVCQRACNHGGGISSPSASYVVPPANGAAATGNGESGCECTSDDDACTCGNNDNGLTLLNHDDQQPPPSACYPTCNADDCHLSCAGSGDADAQSDCDALCRANCQRGGCADDEASDDFYSRTNYVYHNSNGNGAVRLGNSGGYGSGLLSDHDFAEQQQQQQSLQYQQKKPILTMEALALLLQHQQQQLQQNWLASTPKTKFSTTITTTEIAPTKPTNFNGTNGKESSLNCFVKCPQSCQRACGKLKGAVVPMTKNRGDCQTACVSTCSLNCQQQQQQQQRNETGIAETTKQKADDSNKSSTTPRNIVSQKDSTLKTTTSQIMMDEGGIYHAAASLPASNECVPSCRPQCLQICTSAYRKRSSATENWAPQPHQYFQHMGHTVQGWQSKSGKSRMSIHDYRKHLEKLAMVPLKAPYWSPTAPDNYSHSTSKAVQTNPHRPISPFPLSYSSLTSRGNESGGMPDRIVHKKWMSTTTTTILPSTTTTTTAPTSARISTIEKTTMMLEPLRVTTMQPNEITFNQLEKRGNTAARNALKLKQWYEKIQRAGSNDQQPTIAKASPHKFSAQKRHAVGSHLRRPLPVDDTSGSADNDPEHEDEIGRQKQRRDDEDYRPGVKAPISAVALRRQRRFVATASVLSYLPPASHPRVPDMEHLRMLHTPSRFLALNDHAESNIEFRRQSKVGNYYPAETVRMMDAERRMHDDVFMPSDNRDANSAENSGSDDTIMIPPLPIVRSDVEELFSVESHTTKPQKQRVNIRKILKHQQTDESGTMERSERFDQKHEIEDHESDRMSERLDRVGVKNNLQKGDGLSEELADSEETVRHPPLCKTKQKLQNIGPKQTIYGPWSRRKTAVLRRRRIAKTTDFPKSMDNGKETSLAQSKLKLAKKRAKSFRKRSMKPALIGQATFDVDPTEMRHHLQPLPSSNGAKWLERMRNESNTIVERTVNEAAAEPPKTKRKSGACDAVCRRICAGACLSNNGNSERRTSRGVFSDRNGRTSRQIGGCVTGCVGKCTSKCLN